MKFFSFIMGLATGIFFMWMCAFLLQPPTSQFFSYFFGGAVVGGILVGLVFYFIMDRAVEAFYMSYKRKYPNTPSILEEDEEEEEPEDWMLDPDWWRKGKKPED